MEFNIKDTDGREMQRRQTKRVKDREGSDELAALKRAGEILLQRGEKRCRAVGGGLERVGAGLEEELDGFDLFALGRGEERGDGAGVAHVVDGGVAGREALYAGEIVAVNVTKDVVCRARGTGGEVVADAEEKLGTGVGGVLEVEGGAEEPRGKGEG